jgi:hypothetical protein
VPGLLDYASVVQQLGRYFLVRLEASLKSSQTNFQPALLENIRKAALRQTTVQRHLAAFESDLGRVARARLLSLFTARGGLTHSGAGTTTHALFLMNGTLGRF